MFPPAEPTPTFPYRILERVGEGAMGEVFRAEDLELGRLVAIKVIKASFLSAMSSDDAHAMMQRFVQEARAAARLSHPGVATVHRVGTEQGWPFISMEWLDGQTLERYLKDRTRITGDQVVKLGLQVLAVLAAAHEAGVIHRDIKPANLMLTRDGRVKVTDFGIARVQGSSLAMTQAGSILGTPQYAAPEQLAGQSVDARADLYALGGLLYEAAVGRPAFEAASLYELIHLVQTAMPVAPSALIPGLSSGLDAVLLRALAKRPGERFSSAREMARALQATVQRNTTSGIDNTAGPARTSARTLVRVPSVFVEGSTPPLLVASAIRRWPATPLGRQTTSELLDRLLERPLHAPAFCGAVEVRGACLLVCEGIILSAFEPASGKLGDEVFDALPPLVDATLYAVPPGTEPRLIPLMASLLVAPEPQTTGLDASFVDLPQLAAKLGGEGFDGALRFARAGQVGFALFSRGKRVLDLFGAAWAPPGPPARWDDWIATSGAMASVEPRRTIYPTITYRQQLKEFALDVVRPAAPLANSLRSDARAEAQALRLVPREAAGAQLRRGDSTLQSLVESDPACASAWWVLAELPGQFEQFGRTTRWKWLVEPLAEVQVVKLHHQVPGVAVAPFDAATWSADGRLLHLVSRVPDGTKASVERFVTNALAVKEHAVGGSLGAAILVAPQFSEDAIAAYLQALKSGEKRSIFSSLDAFSHKEGFVRVSARHGFHLLLVEEQGGKRRPLVPG
jgi:serine/threonine protein kinase